MPLQLADHCHLRSDGHDDSLSGPLVRRHHLRIATSSEWPVGVTSIGPNISSSLSAILHRLKGISRRLRQRLLLHHRRNSPQDALCGVVMSGGLWLSEIAVSVFCSGLRSLGCRFRGRRWCARGALSPRSLHHRLPSCDFVVVCCAVDRVVADRWLRERVETVSARSSRYLGTAGHLGRCPSNGREMKSNIGSQTVSCGRNRR